MDLVAQGEQPAASESHRPLRRTSLLFLCAILALGCQSTPRKLDPADRELEPPPFAKPSTSPDASVAPAAGDAPENAQSDRSEDPAGSMAPGGDEGDDPDEDTWPNIKDPGPDMANFPNSAFTLPRNAVQLELAPVTLSGPADNNGPSYSTQFLLRYGLTDRLELRLFGLGFFELYHSPQRTTGFAPLAFDMKTNLWRESKNHLIPAAGLEVYLQSEFGSPALRSGLQPSISLLFDHTLPFGINLEWNVGVNGAEKPFTLQHDRPNGPINAYHGPEEEALELNAQWALQRRFFEKLDLFVHGFINGSAIPNLADGVMVGGGGIYKASDRTCLFGSYNAGVTIDASTTFFLLGFAYAL